MRRKFFRINLDGVPIALKLPNGSKLQYQFDIEATVKVWD